MLARAGESDKIYKKDQNSIDKNGLCELMIKENQFMNFNDRVDYLQELSEKLFGVEYYLNDFVSTGIMYYDLLDMYNIEIFGKTYNCLMLNDEQDITQGLEENIHTDRPEKSETDYKKADTTDRKINQTYLIVDKQNQKIEGVISQIGDRSKKTTTITADIDGLNSKVSNIEDLTQTAKGVKTVTLDNCIEGNLLELHIYGNNTVFDYITLSDNLVLSDDLHLKGDSLITVTDKDGKKTEYELNISEPLRQNGDAYDEYILKYGKAQVIRRINADGTIKSTAITEEIKAAEILLKEGKNILTIKNYTASLSAKYAIKSSYSETFATNVKMDSEIKQTAQSIDLSVNKKLESYSTTEEMNSAIKLKTDSIATEVSKKVGKTEVGTYIEQNVDAIKYAWNQISEFIQMMIINNNASFAILDQNKKVLMALDKTGQHFYKSDGTTIFGEMGVNKEDSNSYISFAVDGEYNKDISDGMAWGIKTKSDNKFHPIMYLKNYQVVQQGGSYGQLMLTNADLVLTGSVDEGTGGGIQSGDILFGGSALNGLKFVDTNGNNFINIVKGDNTILKPYDMIEFLDEVIFFKNALGGNSLGVGKKYSAGVFTGCKVVIADDGSIALDGNITLGSNLYWGGGSSLDQGGSVTCTKVYETGTSSDARIKKNIQDSKTSALEIINRIKHKEFDKEDDGKHYKIGYIAQDMEKIDPNFVKIKPKTETTEERYYINELPIIATLTKAIQEQQKQIEELKKEIEKLKGEKNG